MLEDLDEKRATALLSILSFENFWAYYSMSSGNVYKKEVKDSANHLFEKIRELAKIDKGILDKKDLNYTEAKTGFTVEETFEDLKKWAEGDTEVPFSTFMQSKVLLFFLLLSQKNYLCTHLGLNTPPFVFSLEEFHHSERYQRWQPHLPVESMYWYDRNFDETKLSVSQTIVVYGDIRRSQDLMIYTVDYGRFENMLIRFFDTTRNLLDKHLGIFDKFTGDGFLAYFNEYMCKTQDKDFIECFLEFSKQFIEVNESLFIEWRKYVRKLPSEEIMVSLGADLGNIYFGDRSGHLVCIGDSIVWAERMCSAAPAGEIYINNLLANALVDREHIELTHIPGNTKSGESFLASKIRFV